MGISFYTFQQLTLLADIGSGRIKDFRFRDFLLFVTFFPHLIAGPIVHHREMMPQFQKADYRLNRENLAIGFVLLSVGLFKKAILADSIADYVSPIFSDAAAGKPIPLLAAWAGAIGFTLQMYFDFSGYSEMALGLARMVGIKLPMNFNSPLKALSVVDYWSRWHITLTRFLTAYIYNPIAIRLARRRAAAGKPGLSGANIVWSAFFAIVAMPTVVTMLLSGLWHGAGVQFLLFGVLHGVALVINHAWRLVRPRIWPDTAHYQRTTWPIAWMLTFLLVMVALTWFHAASVAAGGNIVAGLIGLHGMARPPAGETKRSGDPLWLDRGAVGHRSGAAERAGNAAPVAAGGHHAGRRTRRPSRSGARPGAETEPIAVPGMGVRDGRDHDDRRTRPEPRLRISLLAILSAHRVVTSDPVMIPGTRAADRGRHGHNSRRHARTGNLQACPHSR